jgi:hypothetical protein
MLAFGHLARLCDLQALDLSRNWLVEVTEYRWAQLAEVVSAVDCQSGERVAIKIARGPKVRDLVAIKEATFFSEMY